ncbi:hypothetical protein NE237_007759 [Protea cynaroides]|uniref:RING-type E3 ubiquitin transferase n=1 Tax=Protea cynaroides TaxID=273540 RepID=A0A9Q0KQ38_9MAGN|nr:hypothetical protein NE237_007759 [Protea cynaroides]
MEASVDNIEGFPCFEEEKIFVAVGIVFEESSSTLLWTLKNFRRKNTCIIHVHQPAQEIRVSRWQQVRAYRKEQKEKMHEILNDYCDICVHAGRIAEKKHIERDNIENGNVELILQHGITKLVMGAAADRHYSRAAGTTPSPSPLASPNIITGQPDQSGNTLLSKSVSHVDGARNVIQNLLRRAISSTTDTTARSAPSSLSMSHSKKKGLTNPAEDPIRGSPFHIGETSVGRTSSSSSSSSEYWTANIQTPRNCYQSSDSLFGLSNSTSTPNLRDYRSDQVKEELQVVEDQKLKLESQIADSDRMVTELVEKKVLSAAQQLVAIQKEIEELQKLRKERNEKLASLQIPQQYFSVFSALEIESATLSFNPSMMIGEGGFGNVYKGILRQTSVAIKRIHSKNSEGQSSSDLQREVDILNKVRHQNLVTLIGVCPEASSIVLEYLPNGSLEDRLTYKDGTLPLPWKTRMRIAKEICSALIFLHCNEPQIVHGDLKPSNILLDCNFVSKVSDFGIANFITRDEENSSSTTTLFCMPDIKGTIAYMDPEFLATGVLTTKADVYSFGLLTGKPAMRLATKVQFALDQGTLDSMLDASTGDWPLDQAKQLAQMALRSCEIRRKNRPNLELEVWKLLN